MAIDILVPGATTVKLQEPSGSIVSLGYARNEPEVSLEPYWHPVHSDEHGGDPGPAADYQLLGLTALIRIRFSKFDTTVADIVDSFVSLASPGVMETSGTLAFSATRSLRLILDNANNPLNFPRCIPTAPVDRNVGTKYQERTMEFRAHEIAGVLYNTTVV